MAAQDLQRVTLFEVDAMSEDPQHMIQACCGCLPKSVPCRREEQEEQPAARVLEGELNLAWIPSLMPARLLVSTSTASSMRSWMSTEGTCSGCWIPAKAAGLSCRVQKAGQSRRQSSSGISPLSAPWADAGCDGSVGGCRGSHGISSKVRIFYLVDQTQYNVGKTARRDRLQR